MYTVELSLELYQESYHEDGLFTRNKIESISSGAFPGAVPRNALVLALRGHGGTAPTAADCVLGGHGAVFCVWVKPIEIENGRPWSN